MRKFCPKRRALCKKRSQMMAKEACRKEGSRRDVLQAKESENGKFMGSITSKKYHRLDCRYALKIKPENRIYFQSIEDAKGQGYLPCKSLQSLEFAYENAGQAGSLGRAGRIGPIDPLLRIA